MSLRVELLFPHLVSVIAALMLAWACWKTPRIARVLFVGLFAAAAAFNLWTAAARPSSYLAFAEITDSPTYRAIILGPFARHVGLYISAIALGQAAIALGLCLRGWPARYAAYGAIVFLVAIAPLGVGSAFPSTIIMAAGIGALLRHGFSRAAWGVPRHDARWVS